ncbi:MAG: hypothetical protein QM504_03245 [Pseudomonadota bacterium]
MSSRNYEQGANNGIAHSIGIILGLIVIIYIIKVPLFNISIVVIKKSMLAIYFIKSDLGLDTSSIANKLIDYDYWSTTMEPTYANIWKLHMFIGQSIKWFVALILSLILAYILITYRYENYFRREFDFSSLKKEYGKINPRILPALIFPDFTPDSLRGPITQSETPWQFAVIHKIIAADKFTSIETRETFDEDTTKKVFQKQCGQILPQPLLKQNTIMLKGASKIMLGIMCAYLEREYELFKELTNESSRWFNAKINIDTNNHKFWMDIPNKYHNIIERLITQAFTQSVTISTHEKIKRDKKNESYVNSILRNAYYKHDFTYTFLMEIFEQIPLISVSHDYKWLKAINRPLFYALNVIGRPSPLTRSHGPHYLYNVENTLFSKNTRLFDKDMLNTTVMTTELLLNMHEWEPLINDFYFSLEDTQWVHHSSYKDVEDNDIINLSEKDFSYENKAYVLIIKQYTGQKLVSKSLHFKRYDGSFIMEPIILNESEILNIKDAARFKALIDAFYLYVNDMTALEYLCYKNKDTLKNIRIIGYNILPDAAEVLGSNAKSWYNIMKEVNRINENEASGMLSEEDMNWGVINSVNDVIGTLYENQE